MPTKVTTEQRNAVLRMTVERRMRERCLPTMSAPGSNFRYAMMAEVSAITGFMDHIRVTHLPEIGHQVGILRQHGLQFLTYPLGLIFDWRQHDPCAQALDEKGIPWVKIGLLAKSGGECNPTIFAEMELDG